MLIKLPIFLALITQVISIAITYVLINLFAHFFSFQFSLTIVAILQGILALSLGRLFNLHRWWMVFNFFFIPCILLLNSFHFESWIFLLGFFILLLANWNSFKERVPLYLSGNDTRLKLEEILKNHSDQFHFVDLGSGLAGMLYDLSRSFPKAEFTGFETAPLVFIVSWFRCLFRKNCHIKYKNIWKVDLSHYDYVYCFLSPVPMPAIWEKAKLEMKKEALLISNTFGIPGVSPTKTIEMHDWRKSEILIWKI
jgi:hypothetical protein